MANFEKSKKSNYYINERNVYICVWFDKRDNTNVWRIVRRTPVGTKWGSMSFKSKESAVEYADKILKHTKANISDAIVSEINNGAYSADIIENNDRYFIGVHGVDVMNDFDEHSYDTIEEAEDSAREILSAYMESAMDALNSLYGVGEIPGDNVAKVESYVSRVMNACKNK